MTDATMTAANLASRTMTPTTGAIGREPRLTIGIDLGDKHSHLCVLDGEGTILEESRLQTKPDAFRQRFGGISPARITIEAGTNSPWANALQPWLRVVASAAKVPLLFVLTLAVSFPSLCVFGALQRLPFDFRNTLRLLLLAIVVNMTVIASLGPVFAFFAASSTSYPFLVLLNVAIFALGGLLGLAVLRRATHDMFRPAAAPSTTPLPPAEVDAALPPAPARSRQAEEQARRLLGVWCVVYGIVGAQMGWLLRPPTCSRSSISDVRSPRNSTKRSTGAPSPLRVTRPPRGPTQSPGDWGEHALERHRPTARTRPALRGSRGSAPRRPRLGHLRRIFSIGRPLANSSTSLSM